MRFRTWLHFQGGAYGDDGDEGDDKIVVGTPSSVLGDEAQGHGDEENVDPAPEKEAAETVDGRRFLRIVVEAILCVV